MQWLLDHPQYIKNPLYIAGDSYSGVIVPQVTLLISNGKHSFILNKKKGAFIHTVYSKHFHCKRVIILVDYGIAGNRDGNVPPMSLLVRA